MNPVRNNNDTPPLNPLNNENFEGEISNGVNPESQTPNPQNPEEASPLKQIRTYQGDVAEALKGQKSSIFSIRRAELKKQGGGNEFTPRRTPEEELERKSKIQAILFMIGAIILLGLGSFGAWYAYHSYKAKTALPAVVVIPNKFISAETTVDMDITGLARDSFISAFNSERSKTIKNGNIEQVELKRGSTATSTLTTTEEFLNVLNAKAPGALVRAFDPLFMVGLIGDNTQASSTTRTFVLIKLDSFENAFAGMLSWETNLANDVLPLFASSETVSTLPSSTTFQDITIQNKDARAIKDPSGKIILLYSFLDNNMLIITDSEASLSMLVTRLNTEKLSR